MDFQQYEEQSQTHLQKLVAVLQMLRDIVTSVPSRRCVAVGHQPLNETARVDVFEQVEKWNPPLPEDMLSRFWTTGSVSGLGGTEKISVPPPSGAAKVSAPALEPALEDSVGQSPGFLDQLGKALKDASKRIWAPWR